MLNILETVRYQRLGSKVLPIGNGIWSIKWSRDRCRHVTPESVVRQYGGISQRLGFLFICYYCAIVIVVTVFICTCFLFCIASYCYSAIRLLSRKCGIKLSVIVKRVACACVGCPLYCSKCSQRNGVVGCNENKCYWKYGRAADGTCQSKTGLRVNLMAFYGWLRVTGAFLHSRLHYDYNDL